MTPWTGAHQAPLSMGLSRQEYWHGLPLPSPGNLPNPGIEPAVLRSPALAGGSFTTSATGKPHLLLTSALRKAEVTVITAGPPGGTKTMGNGACDPTPEGAAAMGLAGGC